MKTQEKNSSIKSKSKFKKEWNGVSATARHTLFEASLYESFFLSLFWHIIGILLLWGLTFSLLFFGVLPKIFPKPEPKIHDIEFIIKNPHQKMIHYPKMEIKPSLTDVKQTADSETNKASSAIRPANTKTQNMLQKSLSTKANSKSATGKGASKSHNHSKSEIADFAIPMSSLKSMSSGLGHSGRTTNNSSGSKASTVGAFSSSPSGGSGSSVHSGFDKTTARKMITTYDISPYVSELKRNIRWNWKAPKENGKRVDLFLRIAKDGRLVILNVKKTSEVGEVDNAALNAVKKSLPLNPLPSKYAKSYLDIIFTFDSNSVGSRY